MEYFIDEYITVKYIFKHDGYRCNWYWKQMKSYHKLIWIRQNDQYGSISMNEKYYMEMYMKRYLEQHSNGASIKRIRGCRPDTPTASLMAASRITLQYLLSLCCWLWYSCTLYCIAIFCWEYKITTQTHNRYQYNICQLNHVTCICNISDG